MNYLFQHRVRSHLMAWAACAIAVLVSAAAAEARPYTVVSCDAAAAFSYSTAAWVPYGNAGRAYSSCPSNSGFTSGISNRMTGEAFSGFEHSGHAFTAPPHTSITQIRWAGRMARDSCKWATFIKAVPSGASVLGYPHGQLCDAKKFDNRGWPITIRTPAGTTKLEQLIACVSSQCDPGAALHAQWVEVTIDDPVPPMVSLSGSLVSGRWVSGVTGRNPTVASAMADHVGIQRVDVRLGDGSDGRAYGCNWSQPRPCPTNPIHTSTPGVADLHDGRHTLLVTATDSAGNSRTESRAVYVDNTPPDPVVPEVIGGTAWRRTNGFAVTWTNADDGASPIVRARWKVCRTDGTCTLRGSHAGDSIERLPPVQLPSSGDFRLYLWLEDAAGNHREANAALSVPLRFDGEAPNVAFAPVDPADPLRVAVNAIDRHSGLATGEIEMRSTGSRTWHGLRAERSGSQLVAYVDDERFRSGAYEFRARAVDNAGNEASTGKRTDGSAARLRLPARIGTHLAVGVRTRPRSPRRLDASVFARYGRRVKLHGRLTNADGQPIDGATIEALERTDDGSALPIGLTTTRRDGRFTYVIRASRNRHVTFRYTGSRRIGAAHRRFRLKVPAATSMGVSNPAVRNGEAVRFLGRVLSRPLPVGGKLIEMQAHFRGRWRTFSTLRTNDRGWWRFPYRFGATLGRVVYRFRVRLPSEGGYPFVTGHSRTTKVVVVGP